MRVSCTSAGMRVSSSTRAILPRRMALTSGLGTRALIGRAVGQQLGVVPAIAQLLFAGARRALDEQRGVADTAAARCSDTQDLAVPGTPYSSRARSVARWRRQSPSAAGCRCGHDLETVAQPPAHQVGDDGPGLKLPVGRALALVHLLQGGQFFGKLVLGMLAQDGEWRLGLLCCWRSWWGSFRKRMLWEGVYRVRWLPLAAGGLAALVSVGWGCASRRCSVWRTATMAWMVCSRSLRLVLVSSWRGRVASASRGAPGGRAQAGR